MKHGYKTFDSDMHVYDAAGVYEKYMNPKWGARIPKGQRDGKHGRVEFKIGGSEKLRAISEVIDHGRRWWRIVMHSPLPGITIRCPNSRAWTSKDWTWRFCFVLHRCIATKRSSPNTPTICAKPGIVGSRISAKKIPSG